MDIGLLVVVSLLGTPRVLADGGFVWGQFEDLHAPEQKAAIAWDGKRETMVLSTRVQATEVSDFGWIIPVESRTQPQVELGDPAIFGHLKDSFLPVVSYGRGGMGDSQQAIEIVEARNLDIYKITVVRATDAELLLQWLQENGFRGGPALESVLNSYRLENFFFVLAKIDLTLKYAKDIDFVLRWQFLADVKSLNGKVAEALAALRSPASDKSLAQLVAEDIAAARPYQLSNLASNPLNAHCGLMTPAEYEELVTRHSAQPGDSRDDLTRQLSEKFLANEKVQHFVRVEGILKDLDSGVASPLRISFEPSKPFFPLRISSINKGKVAVAIYLFADEPLRESGRILQAEVWKSVTDDLRRTIQDALDITRRSCLTKLTFFGDSAAFVQDAHFEPMTGEEKELLVEEQLIVAPLVYDALGIKDVGLLADMLETYPRVHEFLDPCLVLRTVRNTDWYGESHESPEEYALTVSAMVDLLVDSGLDINACDEAGRTALHVVAEPGWRYWVLLGEPDDATTKASAPRSRLATELAAFLLRKGAQVNAKDATGRTPLDLVFDQAQQYANPSFHDMARLLVRHGGTLGILERGDPGCIRGHFTEAVLPVAREVGNKEIIDLLTRGNTDKAAGTTKE